MAKENINEQTEEVISENKTEEVASQNQTEQTHDSVEEQSAPTTVEAGPATADESADAEKKTPSLEEQLVQTQQESAENLDKWQRSVAELANFKRRQDEKMKLERRRIKSEVLEGVISALDDMDLAFQNVPGDLDGQVLGWVEGFRLVQRKLHKVLDDQDVTAIDTSGDFDPNLHEAVSYEASDEHEEGQIIGELRKGYQIGNRVVRPALVRVAS